MIWLFGLYNGIYNIIDFKEDFIVLNIICIFFV